MTEEEEMEKQISGFIYRNASTLLNLFHFMEAKTRNTLSTILVKQQPDKISVNWQAVSLGEEWQLSLHFINDNLY